MKKFMKLVKSYFLFPWYVYKTYQALKPFDWRSSKQELFGKKRERILDLPRYFPIFYCWTLRSRLDEHLAVFDENLYLSEAMTFSAAEKFPLQLLQLLGKENDLISRNHNDYATTKANKKLGQLFDYYGSNKNSHHFYTPYYADLLAQTCRNENVCVLEIGLGSNNTDTPSNMEKAGKPGASLRAFRDFCPEAQIFGADIDRRILFEEERIRTTWVDQLDPDTLR